MTRTSPAAPKQGPERATQVRRLFSEIAPRYDLLNRVLSAGIDRSWRRRAVDALGWERAPAGTYLDACAGTFDLSLELAGRTGFEGRIIGSDFAFGMLERGLPKLSGSPVEPLCADALRLPFPDRTFDGVMVGFGVRNLADLEAGLTELRRVLRPGARLVVLEFTVPPNPVLRAGYLFYFKHILPLVGRVLSGHPWAYRYLPESVGEFPGPEALGGLFERVGFRQVGWRLLTFGIAALHWGEG